MWQKAKHACAQFDCSDRLKIYKLSISEKTQCSEAQCSSMWVGTSLSCQQNYWNNRKSKATKAAQQQQIIAFPITQFCVCNFIIVTDICLKLSHTIVLWWCGIVCIFHCKRPISKKVMSSQSWKSRKAIILFCQTGSQFVFKQHINLLGILNMGSCDIYKIRLSNKTGVLIINKTWE